MLGETDENWQSCIEQTLSLEPDSITIYQMELPFNTTISRDVMKGEGRFTQPVADWATKRRWVKDAFEALEAAGYHVGSAYTAVKDPSRTKFVYRDRLWQGADMVGLGVSSFGHVNGVHVQNLDTWEAYSAAVRRDELPLSRAYKPTDEERMIRELVLQLKLGSIRPAYFREKYDVAVLDRFRPQLESLAESGDLESATEEVVALTRTGLLRVDSLLPRFFLPEHAGIRYT
jgi:oxygen-independent coproporphyrinogen-3 oxidase